MENIRDILLVVIYILSVSLIVLYVISTISKFKENKKEKAELSNFVEKTIESLESNIAPKDIKTKYQLIIIFKDKSNTTYSLIKKDPHLRPIIIWFNFYKWYTSRENSKSYFMESDEGRNIVELKKESIDHIEFKIEEVQI